ncbi:unnamed protein product [Chrysoparadoxa australica]
MRKEEAIERSNKRFNLIRRNSLRNEVDGIWDGFEKVEDEDIMGGNSRKPSQAEISHSECVMLQRVLSEKANIPSVCQGFENAPSSNQAKYPNQLARRLSGGAPGAFNDYSPKTGKKETRLGGKIGLDDCRRLQSFLAPSVGGSYLIPAGCTNILKANEQQANA